MRFSFVVVASLLTLACGSKGDPGQQGPVGPAGQQGTPGPIGPQGPGAPDASTNAACTAPCHTFNGVVDQWRFSNHSHPQENQVGTGPCGNCHALDGIQQRVAGNYFLPPDAGTPQDVAKGHISYLTPTNTAGEISYGGAVTVGRIHCSTCHDFNANNDPHIVGKYVAGSAPIRVAGGMNDEVVLEKSPDKMSVAGTKLTMGAGNVCVFCHKSRKDVTWYINPTTNALSSLYWGPHEGPMADVYSGKGGYEFVNKSYGSSTHATIQDTCVACHMQPVAANLNTPDHTMTPTVAFCKTCHKTYMGNNFDIQGGETIVKAALTELQSLLNNKGFLTRSATAPYAALQPDELADGQYQLDRVRPGSGPNNTNQVVDGPTAGALYDYLIIARGGAFGAHNPTYTKQLLWDAIVQIKGSNPSSLPSRPN